MKVGGHENKWSYKCVPVSADLNASCLFYPALDRPEGVSQQDYAAMEEFQQRTNAFSLERVKAYYRKLRYTMLCTATQPSSGSLTSTQDIFHLKGRVHSVVLHKQAEITLWLLFKCNFYSFQGLHFSRWQLYHFFSSAPNKVAFWLMGFFWFHDRFANCQKAPYLSNIIMCDQDFVVNVVNESKHSQCLRIA